RPLEQPCLNCRTFRCWSLHLSDATRLVAPAKDAPDAGGGPALAGLGRLLQTSDAAAIHDIYRCVVHSQAAVLLSSEELGEAADVRAGLQDALLQVIGGLDASVAAQAIGDHSGVHRPARSVVVGPSAEPRGHG